MTSKQEIRELVDTLALIAEHNFSGTYIYRGESRCHDRVSSGLFRQLHEIDNGLFDIMEAQKRQLEVARAYTKATNDLEILAEIQHRGGKTNLIDFTNDINIALFFACNYSPDQDGRIIFFRNEHWDDYAIDRALEPSNMADVQRSIFVRPRHGYIKEEDMLIVEVPSSLKVDIVAHLRTMYGLESSSVYNDISGFIRDQHLFPDFEADFFAGQEYASTGNYDKAIECYTRCLTHPQPLFLGLIHFARGIAFFHVGRREEALRDFQAYDRRNWETKPHLPPQLREWIDEANQTEQEEAERQRELNAMNNAGKVNAIHRIWLESHDLAGNNVDGAMFTLLSEYGYRYEQLIGGEGALITVPNLCHGGKCWFWFKKDGYRSVNGKQVQMGDSFIATLKPLDSNPGAPEITVTATYQITEVPT